MQSQNVFGTQNWQNFVEFKNDAIILAYMSSVTQISHPLERLESSSFCNRRQFLLFYFVPRRTSIAKSDQLHERHVASRRQNRHGQQQQQQQWRQAQRRLMRNFADIKPQITGFMQLWTYGSSMMASCIHTETSSITAGFQCDGQTHAFGDKTISALWTLKQSLV